MNKLNVKKGDTVVVISGKDKGKQGKILVAYPEKERVVVQNANMIVKHVKPVANVSPNVHIISSSLHLIHSRHLLAAAHMPKVKQLPPHVRSDVSDVKNVSSSSDVLLSFLIRVRSVLIVLCVPDADFAARYVRCMR